MSINGSILQAFEWDLPNDGQHWNRLKEMAPILSEMGITAVWIPPFTKPVRLNDGLDEVGYGVYDLWDLGEFDQSGMIRTKYGTKEELQSMIHELHKYNIQVYADMVMNHKIGHDSNITQTSAREVSKYNRYEFLTQNQEIKAYLNFEFPVREGKYSEFHWKPEHFTGTDSAAMGKTLPNGDPAHIYLLKGKTWDEETDKREMGNFDYLLGSDIDLRHPDVQNELIQWGKWVTKELGLDGYRLDALKHMNRSFVKNWIQEMEHHAENPLFTLGEFWSGDLYANLEYLDRMNHCLSLVDARLHWNLYSASMSNGYYDLRGLLHETLMKNLPMHAVTFVDNHDTQPRHGHGSFIEKWFKTHAYTLILTREEGYPCLFWGDLFGMPSHGFSSMKNELNTLLHIRKHYAYGKQHEFPFHDQCIGWTREGIAEKSNSGCAVLLNTGTPQRQWVYVGERHAGQVWIDVISKKHRSVVQVSGWIELFVDAKCVSIYVNEKGLSLPTYELLPIYDNYLTIYYKPNSSFGKPHVHYRRIDDPLWTREPVPMSSLDNGWYKFSIDLFQASCAEFVFKGDFDQWDNCHYQNYKANSGDCFIEQNKISLKKPDRLSLNHDS